MIHHIEVFMILMNIHIQNFIEVVEAILETMEKPKFLLKKTYLQMIENSVGTKMFRSVFVMDGQEKDVTENGELSCAVFVSSLLKFFDLISLPHATIESTIKDMIENGWKEVEKSQKGDVLLWEKMKIGGSINEHIGFYIGNEKAISNSLKKRTPIVHHYTYNQKRKIIKIYAQEKIK